MIGVIVGNYRIVGELGRGGMGVVYRAEHVHLGRPAALKMLHPSMSSDQVIVQRFFNEARAASAIDHPGIVAIHDFGVHSDGRAYLVMALLRGESLQRRLERGGVGPAEACNILGQVCAALAAAHAQGIVHRDLKPDNIFLAANEMMPGGVQAVLLDFGIAKLADDRTSGLRTQTGSLLGTPAYMSPEQCMGRSDIDYRTDLYSLGCVLFHVLCGRPPFLSEHGTGMMIAAQIRDEPPHPRALNPHAPESLAAIALRLLAKDPAARFRSAGELRSALQVAAGGLTDVQPPPVHVPVAYAPTALPGGDTTQGAAAAELVSPRPPAATVEPRRRGLALWLSLLVLALAGAAVAIVVVVVGGGEDEEPAGAADEAMVAAADPMIAPSPPATPPSPPATPAATPPAPPPGPPAPPAASPAPPAVATPPATVPPTASPVAPTFRLAATTVQAGSPIVIRFPRPVPSRPGSQAWITVVEADAPPESYGAWEWVKDRASAVTLAAPKKAGRYEVRLHTDYPKHRANLRHRVALMVTSDEPPEPPATPDDQQRFRLADGTVAAGRDVELVFATAMRARKGERFWVTVVEADKPDSAWGKYEYVPAGATSMRIAVPAEPGQYEVRLHANYPTRATNVVHRASITIE